MKFTSAEPFTPKFVKEHLTKPGKSTTKKLSSSRAQALYNERVRRRQLGLVGRSDQKEKKKKGAVVKGEKMGRREAAEKGIWRLREEEARCVPDVLFLREGGRGFDFLFALGFLPLGGMHLSRCIGCGLGICPSCLDW